jgi:hypothetical protein
MILAAGLLVAAVGSLAPIILELRRAPEAYEDERGFHAARVRVVGDVGYAVPRSMIKNLSGGPVL